MQIDELDIRRIKDAAGILDVMRDFIPNIRKAGADYECLCPFHKITLACLITKNLWKSIHFMTI